MASIRRSTPPTRRFGAHDDESPMMVSSTGSRSGKRKPLGNRGSATATGLSRSPLKARTVVTASNNKQQRQNSTHNTSVVPRRPSIRTTPGTDKKQNLQAQEKTAATSVSHDKENQVNKRQPGRNDGKKDKTTTKSVLRTPNTATTTKRAPCASQSVAFTPATKPPPAASRTTSTPCNRGSGLNALRRSLRESITPPNQKQRKGTIVDPADTTLQSQHSSSISFQTSAFQATSSTRPHFTQQLPKTPKSMLKEQLDLSFDEEESMLLSPGAATILSFPKAASALPTCQTVEEEEEKKENNQIIFKESYELIADNATKTSEPKLLHTESQNRLNSENSIKPKSVDAMTKSVFSASRRDPRRELKRNKMRVQSQSKVTPVITTLSIETIEKDNSEQHPDHPPPHQTPYVIQDTSHYKPVTIEKSKFATPYSKQGNGVCMDLTTMFFSEQKTIRKCNKVGAPIKEPQETPKTAGSSDENLLVSTGMPGEDEWAERQCNTFAKWLNFTLDPNDPEESEEGQNEEAVTQDEFKSRSALRTLMLHQRMAKARVAASQVYQGEHMQKVRAVIQSEVQKGKLLIRADRDMYADLTLRKKIISLLFSYSTPWLRVGLETLFGETILPDVPTQFSPAKRNTHDYRKTSSYQLRVAMRDFIVNRVLSDSTVLAKYTKGRCKVPSGNFETRYRAEMRSLVLSRLFILFFFLDQAKKENVIDKSPRLFAKSAQVKSSREVLISFCRDFLASEGDITKHLSRVGLKVAYSQDPMDEINLRITNFAVDLRDGIRLAKLAEVLMGAKPKSLLSKLRIPAVSRLQKLHNVGIALQALKALPISEEIVAHHIVDGHRAMVLKLMWTIIAHYCFPATLDFSAVEEEIVLVKGKLRAREGTSEITSNATLSFMNEQSIDANSPQHKGRKLLLQWCQAVCALFGIEVNDFSTSFADGKALCYLMHYYHPTMVPLEEIRPTTKDNHLVARLSVDQARYNERTNSTLAHTKISELGGIPDLKPTIDTSMPPDEKCMMVYLCYACSRLLASRNEVQACTVIQSRYREHKARIIMAKQTRAALKICEYWKKHKENYYNNQKHRYGSAIAKIEEWVLERQEQLRLLKVRRLEREMTREATVLVQNQIRGFLARQKVILLSKQNLIAINMQRYFRKKRAIRTYNEMAKAQFSAIQLQSLWRGFQTRYALSIKVSSIIFIQAVMRGHSIRRQIHFERRACICIQRYWRGFLGELQFQMDLLDIVAVQNTWRRRKAIRSWKLRSHSVIAIQQATRRFIARCKYHNRRRAAEALLKDHGNATSIQVSFYCIH